MPVILPLILCLFPLVILLWEHQASLPVLERDRDHVLKQKLLPLAEAMRRQSSQEYWPGRFLRRFKGLAEQALQNNFDQVLPAKAAELLKQAPYQRMPAFRMWLGYFPGGNLQKNPQLCAGDGLTTSSRVIFAGLLGEMARRLSGLSSTLESASWEGRLTGIFGFAIRPRFFLEEFRGVPFPVIYNNRFRYCVWNTILQRGKMVGLALALVDMEAERKDLGIRNILANWSHRGVSPAFIPFPLDVGKSRYRVLAPSRILTSAARGIIDRVQAGMQIMSPDPQWDLVGHLHLPFSQVGKVIRQGDWRYMLVNLGPESRYVGMLLCRSPRKYSSSAAQMAQVWAGCCLLFWGGVYLFFRLHGRLPDIGVRGSLMLWFFLLIAVPVVLGLNTSFSLLKDREKNLTEYVKRKLVTVLSDIEAGSGKILPNQEKALVEFLQNPRIHAALDEVRQGKKNSDVVLAQLWEGISGLGINPGTLTVFGPGGFFLKKGGFGIPPQGREFLVQTLRSSWFDKIPNTDLENVATWTGALPDSGSFRLLSKSSPIPLFSGNKTDQIERFCFASIQFMSLSTRLLRHEKVAYVIGILWDNDFTNLGYLREQIPRLPISQPGVDIAAFRKDPEGLTLVSAKGNPAGLKTFGKRARDSQMSELRQDAAVPSVLVAFPSFRLPKYVLVGRASLSGVFQEIRNLTWFLVILMTAALCLLGLTVLALSRNLAQPIIRMSNGLKSIAQGNLEVEVAEPRGDELEEAGVIIDQMTVSLRERRQLSSFVPPEVLRLVSQGDLQRIIGGKKQDVSVLVSDMRGFTAISETTPPDLVFSALNEHLTAMARVIQSHGGIIDRFVGDAVIAVFHPGQGAHHALRTVQAARQMMATHQELLKERQARGLFAYAIGIGIDTGEVVTGITGTEDVRLDLTALGDPLVRANALEALSKKGMYSRIVVSEKVRHLAEPHFRFQPLAEAWELEEPGEAASHALAVPKFIAPGELPTAEKNTPATVSLQPVAMSTGTSSVAATTGLLSPAFQAASPICHVLEAGGKQRRFFLPFWLAAGLWLIPVLIVLLGLENLTSADDQRRLEKARQVLQDDGDYLEKALNPEFGYSLGLNRSIRNAREKAFLASQPLPIFLNAIKNEFGQRSAELPEIAWDFLRISPPPTLATASFSNLTLERTDNQAGASPTAWIGTNLDSVPFPGTHTIDCGRGCIRASGYSHWDLKEVGYFLFTPWSGDGTLTVDLNTFSTPNARTRLGIMIRQDLASTSPFIEFSQSATGPNLVRYRLAPGAKTEGGTFPESFNRIQVLRQGISYFVSFSRDGKKWHRYGPYAVPLGETPIAGVMFHPMIDARIPADYGMSVASEARKHAFADPVFSRTFSWAAFYVLLAREIANAEAPEDLYGFMFARANHKQISEADNPKDLLERSWGRVVMTQLQDRSRYIFWLPIWRKDFMLPGDTLEQALSERQPRSFWNGSLSEVTRNYFLGLEGILLVTIDSRDTQSSYLEMVRRDYEQRGGKLAIWSRETPSRLLCASPEMGGQRREEKSSEEGNQIVNDGQKLTTSLVPPLNRKYRIVYSRPLPENLQLSLVWFWVLGGGLLWIVGGFGFLILVYGFGWTPSIPLKIQMSGVFLTAILPILLLALLIIEQSRIEFEARTQNDEVNALEETCRLVDEGNRLCQGFIRALLTHQFLKTDFLRELDSVDWKLPTAKKSISELLEKLDINLGKRGLKVFSINLYSMAMAFVNYPSCNSTSEVNPLAKIFSYICYTLGKSVSPELASPGDRSQEIKQTDLLIMGTQLEEFQKILAILQEGSSLLNLLQSPYYCGSVFTGQDSAESIYRHAIFLKKKLRYDLQATWQSPNLAQNLFREWDARFGEPGREKPAHLVFLDKTYPASFLVPPFFSFRPYYRDFRTEMHAQLLPLDLIPFAGLAADSKEPLWIHSGDNTRERITRIFPGLLLDKWLIMAELNLFRLFEPIIEATRQKRLLLVILILVCMLLAGRVTERFLAPIRELSLAANQITLGNFKVRMAENFVGEFGALATAFNKMAAEAQEGRLLGQFVSESVRMSARQGHLRETARNGEHQDLIVMFSSLGGFKEALEQYPPADLIERLNLYLKTMSPIIRHHGGEIDKFIGDKILAVFRPSPGELPEKVAPTALQAAVAMREAMARLQDEFPMRQGIGLVAGSVLAGILGSEQVRLEYTVIGDTVNLASRLSDLAAGKPEGAIFLEDNMYRALRNLPDSVNQIRPLAATAVKGKKREVQVYEVVC